MRNRHIIPLAILVLGVVACTKKVTPPAAPRLEKVLPVIPLPPGGQPLVSQSGKNATQWVLVTAVVPDSVVAYYRQVLSMAPFHLVNETKTNGIVAFYAEQNGPSLWVTVQANGDAGSQVIIAGASNDSTILKKLAPPMAQSHPASGDSALRKGIGG